MFLSTIRAKEYAEHGEKSPRLSEDRRASLVKRFRDLRDTNDGERELIAYGEGERRATGWDSPLTRPAFLAHHARLAGYHSDLMNRQLIVAMPAPIVSASQSSQLESRSGTKA